jgi:hypothetical protein
MRNPNNVYITNRGIERYLGHGYRIDDVVLVHGDNLGVVIGYSSYDWLPVVTYGVETFSAPLSALQKVDSLEGSC